MKIRKLLFLNGVSLFLMLVCLLLSSHVSGLLYNVQTAQRWKGESEHRFAHLACYFPLSEGKNREDVRALRDNVEQTLLEVGLSASEQGRLYTDAYCGFGTVTAVGEHGSVTLSAVGVGGEFFVFHPLRLLSGGYITEKDLMKDRVVLDELAAWQLFGSRDVAGLFIDINDTRYYVAGVVNREDDYASRKAGDDIPRIFLSYDALSAISDTAITSYEIVMPEPVQNFGTELLRERFAAGSSAEVVDQSRRYSASNLWNTFWSMGERTMGGTGILYPQWEKAIRLTEFHLSMLLILVMAFAVVPVITVTVAATMLLCKGVKMGKRWLPAALEQYIEQRKEKKYLHKAGERDWQQLL